MRKLSLFLLVSVFVFCGCSNDDDAKPYVLRYILSLPTYAAETTYYGDTENPVDEWESYGTPYYWTYLHDNTGIFEFDCISSSYGIGMDAFGFTNCTSGDYSAVTQKGVTNRTYVIVGASGYGAGSNSDQEVAIRFKDNNTSNPKEYQVKGLYITNSVYAYNSMKNGSELFGEEDKFGSNDSFKLTIYNIDKTRKVECYLAQGTNILTEWKWIDLTPLGKTDGLKVALTTTKTNEYGDMTPSYFCLDGITIEE